MCDWVRFSVGGVWGGRSCVPCCAWRARGGVHAVVIAQCAVFAAVWTSCGRAGLVCLYAACECAMSRVACRCALFWVTRAMTLTCRCARCGLSHRVCLCARVCGVMIAGSVALVGMCVRCALGPRKFGASWLRHTRDV